MPAQTPTPNQVPAPTPNFRPPPNTTALSEIEDDKLPSIYTYRTINTYPHDPEACTQGLAFDNGVLYEGTGLYGNSSMLTVSLETGEDMQSHSLPAKYFGEGITVYRDTIVQLTWKSRIGFVYDRDSFDLLREFFYPTEGWGITHDGDRIIIRDGSSTLYFLDAETLEIVGSIEVHDNDAPVDMINELKYVKGRIYANIWQTDRTAIIEPADGRITGWIDLSGLLQGQDYNQGK